jgi:isatin hydrolase
VQRLQETSRPSDVLDVLAGARWIDLSVLVSNDHPSYPYSMPFRRTVWSYYSEQFPYHTAWWALDEHTGTHFDAPAHFVPPPEHPHPAAGEAGRITAEKVPLEQLRGAARVIDVRSLLHQAETGYSPMILPEHILEHERAHGPIEPNDIAIFWTGWDRFWQRGDAGSGYFLDVYAELTPGWTAPSVEATELLLERGVRALATDAASIGSVDDGARTHLAGLREGMTFVEGLTRLEELPPVGAFFIFLPVKVEGGSGGPGRAVAIVPQVGG